MITTIKIQNASDFKLSYINKVLKEVVRQFGEVEITINAKDESAKSEIDKRIEDVENGGEMYYFSADAFEQLRTDLEKGIKPNTANLAKVKKNAKGDFVSI